MKDYFHEAHVAMNVAQLEYWTTNSLSAVGANSTNHAIETAVRNIWEKATGEIFPHDYFKPYHKPVAYIKRMGLWPYYSPQTQGFMEKQHGMALDQVRYENTQAYGDHTNPKSRMRGKELIAGTLAVLEETKKLSHNGAVLECIRQYASKLRENASRWRQLPVAGFCAPSVKWNLAGDDPTVEHGGGLNQCGCHFNRKTGQCHCHQPKGCGCACQPATCP